jgi:hypothetical protein
MNGPRHRHTRARPDIDAPAVVHLRPGRRLARFIVQDVVTYDGFVTIYRARGVRHSGELLLHEFFPAACATRNDDGSIRASTRGRELEYSRGSQRFLELADRLAGVRHANVEEVTDVLAVNGTAYLVTADLQAESLQQRYADRQRFPADEVLGMALGLLAGLERIHLAGLIHGDIGESSIRFTGAVPQLVHTPAALLANFRRLTMAAPSIDPRRAPAAAGSESAPDIYEFGLMLHRLAKGKSARNDAGPDDPSGALMRAVLRVIERAFSGPREFRPRSAGEWRGEFEMVRDLPGADAR